MFKTLPSVIKAVSMLFRPLAAAKAFASENGNQNPANKLGGAQNPANQFGNASLE